MKSKLISSISIVLISMASMASGATILASNYNSADSSVVVNVAGVQIANGYAAIGYFTITDAAILTSNSSQLAAGLQVLGASGGTSYEVGGGFFMNGAFDLSASSTTNAGSSFIGKNAYLVVGNGLTLETSSQAFIYKTTTLFSADPSSPITLDFTAGPPAGTAIFGLTGQTVTTQFSSAGGTAAGNMVTTAYRTASIVPEPSAALLGIFGALAFLRRRRN